MKKIFRMALVFALAGATLLYTGCSKDYTEDINKLNSDFSSLQSEYKAAVANLESEIANAKSSISALESAYKKADDALQKAIDANASGIDANAKSIKALQADVDAAEANIADLTSKVEANSKALAELKAALADYATKKELNAAKEELNGKIDSAVKDLEAKIAALSTDLAKQVADAKAEILTKVEALSSDIAKAKADVTSALTAAVAAQKGTDAAQDAKIKALEDAVAALQNAKKDADEAASILANELRSLVFVPDLYLAGIEATQYNYGIFDEKAFVNVEKVVTAKDFYPYYGENVDKTKKVFNFYGRAVTNDEVEVDPSNNYTVDFATKAMTVTTGEVYSQGRTAKIYYNLNPSSFDVNKAEWTLYGYDKPYVVRGEEAEVKAAETWKPVVLGVANVDGNAEVEYTIENPALMNGLVVSTVKNAALWFIEWTDAQQKTPKYIKKDAPQIIVDLEKAYKSVKEEQYEALAMDALGAYISGELTPMVSIVNLEAKIGDKTVESDYEAVVSNAEMFKALAFGTKTSYSTEMEPCTQIDPKNGRELYTSVFDAIVEPWSVDVTYNAGPVDLAKLITIHAADVLDFSDLIETTDYNVELAEKELTVAELNAAYGDRFTLKFEAAPYVIGNEVTPQSAYGSLTEAGVFQPQYVVENVAEGTWESFDCPEGADSKVGISSVGRYPVVLAKLYDGEKLLLAGWFKIKIVKEPVKPINKEIVIPTLNPEIPYLCGEFEARTNWHQFSSLVLEALGTDYEGFSAWTLDGENGVANLYEIVKGEYKALSPADKFGTVEYFQDYEGTGVNDAFVWSVKPQAVVAANPKERTATVYVHFQKSEIEHAWVKLTVKVADKASVEFGTKIPKYWFNDVNDEVDINTARANVLVPNKTSDDVTVFAKNLQDYFVGNQLKVSFTEEAAKIYGDKEYDAEIDYKYAFAKDQPTFNFTDAAGKAVKVTLTVANDTVLFAQTNRAGSKKDTLAVLSNAENDKLECKSLITYQTNDLAKELLNLWGKSETDDTKMIYANITVKATYAESDEDCNIEGGDLNFHLRFIRPVETLAGKGGELIDAVPGGSEVLLGNFFGAVDWQGFEIVKFVAATEDAPAKYVPGTYTTLDNEVINWFVYYGFNSMSVDLGKIETDQTNEWKLLDEVNPSVIKKIVDKSTTPATEVEAVEDVVTVEFNATDVEIPELANIALRIENNMGVVEDFNLRVPVKLTYAWGDLYFMAEIPVHKTYTPKN